MSFKSVIVKPFIGLLHNKILSNKTKALEHQRKIFNHLLLIGKETLIGKALHLKNVSTFAEFNQAVPIVEYENIKQYINKIQDGDVDVLWKGKPIYFAKTSGTTSGVKYIPITKDSLPNHINTARNALIEYLATTKKTNLLKGKMIFLSGSPELEYQKQIPIGRLSGIVNHHVPNYLKGNQLPSYTTNCLENWEEKLEQIIIETKQQDLRLISGIPPWVQMYFERILNRTKKNNVKDIFPNLQLLVHGGVNFKPYKKILEEYIGGVIDTIETYPASEGFLAYQDTQDNEGLLLNTNSGIYFEFIEVNNLHTANTKRVNLEAVECNINYVVIINSNAGLWGYNIGDTIKFVSINPYRIIVTGRIKHFISAFGEHVIAEEVEWAMQQTMQLLNFRIKEFTVAPNILTQGQAHHEWLIEFDKNGEANLDEIEKMLDEMLCKKNIYYKDLIAGNILKTLKVKRIKENGFINYMKSIGKLGEQNKMPRLSNDRNIANDLNIYLISK